MSGSICLNVNNDLKLVSPKMEMTDSIFELIDENRAYLDKHISFAYNKNTTESIAAFLREIINFNYGGQKFNLIIEYKRQIAGVIGLHRIYPQDARAEIGYWIGESFQKNGIMTLAMPVFLHYAFEALAVNRVELITLTDHHRSAALAERTGFYREGILRAYFFMHEKFNDAYIYSQLKTEFLAQKA